MKGQSIDHHITNDTDYPHDHSNSQPSHPGPHGSQASISSSRRRSFMRINENADTLYRPSPSPSPSPSPELNELEDQYSDRSQSVTPEHAPPKRFKLTDGAWVRYDIPVDKLPPNSPVKPRAAKRPDARVRYARTRFEPSSQVSQIEEPEDSQDQHRQEDRYNQDETIESNWSYSQSERERGKSRGRLDMIVEEGEEDEDGSGVERREILDLQPSKNGSWVEPGFFEKTEDLPFTIWRDGY